MQIVTAPRIWPLIAIFWITPAIAQNTLGALLEAGARPLSAEEFKEELVQRTLVGPTPIGATMEMIYVSNGTIQGVVTGTMTQRSTSMSGIGGEWKVDSAARICTSLSMVYSTGSSVVLPARCQYWFKLGDKYFFADSDTDRSARVLSRTIKQ